MLKKKLRNSFIFASIFWLMMWHIIRYCISLLLPVFYRSIQGKNVHRLHRKGPAIIAMNHPNAFTDPILLTYVGYPLRTWYMARGDAFKPGIISTLLESIGIVPIFRLQDGGREGLKKNDEAYRRVNALLKRKRKVIVFAEGICVQERRLRPLKKGVARMVFGASELPGMEDLMVYPVGINYSNPRQFRSTVFYNVGEPIAMRDFKALYQENAARANNRFLQELESRMKDLITHIDEEKYDEAVYMAETLRKRDLLQEAGLNPNRLADDFEVLKDITERVNRSVATQPTLVDDFMTQGKSYFRELEQQGLEDWALDPAYGIKVNPLKMFGRYLLLILGFPLHLCGLAGSYVPIKITGFLAGKAAKKKEFYSSMWIGFSLFTFLIWFLLLFFGVYAASETVLQPLLVLLVSALGCWFSLHYVTFYHRTKVMAALLHLSGRAESLKQERRQLVALINKF